MFLLLIPKVILLQFQLNNGTFYNPIITVCIFKQNTQLCKEHNWLDSDFIIIAVNWVLSLRILTLCIIVQHCYERNFKYPLFRNCLFNNRSVSKLQTPFTT